MIDAYEAALLTQAFACNARIEGMKADNAYWLHQGSGPAYNAEAFNTEARELEWISQALRSRAGL